VNRKQQIILMVYAVVVVVMVIYPPFSLKLQGHVVRSEYSWLWEPIMLGKEYGSTALGTIDVARLYVQLVAASLVAIALTLSFKRTEL